MSGVGSLDRGGTNDLALVVVDNEADAVQMLCVQWEDNVDGYMLEAVGGEGGD